jgi:hypothetical protein
MMKWTNINHCVSPRHPYLPKQKVATRASTKVARGRVVLAKPIKFELPKFAKPSNIVKASKKTKDKPLIPGLKNA